MREVNGIRGGRLLRSALAVLALCGQVLGQTPDSGQRPSPAAAPGASPAAAPGMTEPAEPGAARGEAGDQPADAAAPGKAEEGGEKKEEEKKWSFSLSAYTYFVPDAEDYVQPTFTADRGWLHLEMRYNYEALETASAWAGYNFSGGETLEWEFTPMLGGAFGDVYGVAPGYRGSLGWWKLELYSEGEYLIDTGDTSDSFFYNWSELTLAPLEWFKFGMVTQRTRAYEVDRDVQRGLLAELSYQALSLRGIIFNLDEPKPLVVVAVGLSF